MQTGDKLSKQASILWLQHDSVSAIILERQIFAEALEEKMLDCAIETQFTGINNFLSRRKIQSLIGEYTKKWILNGSVLEEYLSNYQNKGNRPIVLFLNAFYAVNRYPVAALKYLKRKYNALFVLYYIDTTERAVSIYANYLREKGVFDLVYTFDEADADKYGLLFWQTPYSVMKMSLDKQIDLYFGGSDIDNRREIIKNILCAKNLKCKMDLVQGENKYDYHDERVSVYSSEGIRPCYIEMLERTVQANCILEIVRPGQIGFTLRAFEAVVYNKKLLTNNENIKNFTFYNPEYMKVFRRVEEIDWDWVKDKAPVDYHYDGSFSPLRFIEEIENRAWQMKESH